MLRLTRLTQSAQRGSEIVLKAEGQIVAEWVPVLEAECRELLGTDQVVVLDLGAVSYLDTRAVGLLRRLTGGPLKLVNCSPLIEELLTVDAI